MTHKLMLAIAIALTVTACSVPKQTAQKEEITFPENYKDVRTMSSREDEGVLLNPGLFFEYLEKGLEVELDSTKPVVIIYYPGKDPCNAGGSQDQEWFKNWYEDMEAGLAEIAEVTTLYVYKEEEGLDKYRGIEDWKKDPGGLIESTFFEYHYPCNSFVVVTKEGEYISSFGEFPQEAVWLTVAKLKK